MATETKEMVPGLPEQPDNLNVGALTGNDDIRVQRVSDVALVYPSRGGSPRWKGPVKSV